MPSREIAALSVESTMSKEEMAGPQEETAAAIAWPPNEPVELNPNKLDRDKDNRGEDDI